MRNERIMVGCDASWRQDSIGSIEDSVSDSLFIVLVAVAAMGFGALFVVHGRLMRRKVERLRRVGLRASAVVVRYEYEDDADGESTPYPLVQFQAPDGRLVTARTDFGGSFVPDIGEHVDVLFDPERPEEAHIESQRFDRVNRLVGVIGWVSIIVGAAIAAVFFLFVIVPDLYLQR
jgi:hypothetical protein